MKNREKWAEKIIDIALKGDTMGLKDGKPVGCTTISCAECDLYRSCRYGPGTSTEQHVRAWAEAEAKERKEGSGK